MSKRREYNIWKGGWVVVSYDEWVAAQPGPQGTPTPVSECERLKIAFILSGPEVRESIVRALTEMAFSQ